jgi:UDP-glucose 4-epimerase
MRTLKSQNILVTGGAGFIGSHLVDRLILENCQSITIVDNFFLGNLENVSNASRNLRSLEVIRMDSSDLSGMEDIISSRNIDTVFNLAVVPLPTSLEYPAYTIATNISSVTNLCELARKGTFEYLLHSSSSEAYGSAEYVPMDEKHPLNAITPYASSKAAGDKILETYVNTFEINGRIVRPFNTIGPRQNAGSYAGIIPVVINRIKEGKEILIYGDGLQTRDFIFVKDSVNIMVKALECEKARGRTINIASGTEISIKELIYKMLKILGIENYPVVYAPPRPGDVYRHLADVSLCEELLGIKPAPLSDQDLSETMDWYFTSND